MSNVNLFRTKAQAESFAAECFGGLTHTSKMPSASYSLPAKACRTGSKLAKVPGSVCAGCYALKGRYMLSNVVNAQARRLATIPTEHDENAWQEWENKWARVLAFLGERNPNGPFWRWHDSGDVQSFRHLRAIVNVARAVPGVRFWLPTKEYADVTKLRRDGIEIPSNLVIRVSAPMLDRSAPASYSHVSTVATTPESLAERIAAGSHECPAPSQGGSCGDCRACWSADVREVTYHVH